MRQSLAAKIAVWWRRLLDLPDPPALDGREFEGVERPWLYRWDYLPRRSAGPGLSLAERREAHVRARDVACTTLGEPLWNRLLRTGYLDLPSQHFEGVTYRLRIGRRIEVLCAPGCQSPWPYPFLCINPTYPLPEEEFFAHLYLYVRDREDIIIRVAAPQPWDQALGRTF